MCKCVLLHDDILNSDWFGAFLFFFSASCMRTCPQNSSSTSFRRRTRSLWQGPAGSTGMMPLCTSRIRSCKFRILSCLRESWSSLPMLSQIRIEHSIRTIIVVILIKIVVWVSQATIVRGLMRRDPHLSIFNWSFFKSNLLWYMFLIYSLLISELWFSINIEHLILRSLRSLDLSTCFLI